MLLCNFMLIYEALRSMSTTLKVTEFHSPDYFLSVKLSRLLRMPVLKGSFQVAGQWAEGSLLAVIRFPKDKS